MKTRRGVRDATLVSAMLVAAVTLLIGGPQGPRPTAAAWQVITACPGPSNPITVDTQLGADLVARPFVDNPCVAFGGRALGAVSHGASSVLLITLLYAQKGRRRQARRRMRICSPQAEPPQTIPDRQLPSD